MDSPTAIKILSTLGHEGRLSIFRLLARRAPDALRPSEMALACRLKHSTLSAHLATLSQAGLIQSRREGTAMYYSLATGQTRDFTSYLLEECCRNRPDLCLPTAPTAPAPREAKPGPATILFICTGNSARSILAEVLMRDIGKGRFKTYSAGSYATGKVNPNTLDLLDRSDHDIDGLHSKSLEEMQGPDAPVFDFVFTVCDHAANEECPAWPGQPVSAHWGMPDPAAVTGTDAEVALAFAEAYRTLHTRIEAFAALPLATLDRMSLQAEADRIGALPPTS
ncbi:metalloregulator ArsR/SmtB family transcription factor [Rhodophyticola sp. CCM32]|uniref:metalloregulator ArsR/SmtB family transcription factor n=1 Tax=Rhodophyticola sp. CCM32 TaxID=2916397 RepID=UPI00107F982E|nr:metalloregulator ArsR/SmtB family transcription factor [Rhodophyticola sp. CCM32]QBY00291.1 metalloregulator ArsR/SmtB family transcription factor [Rhodophyticola sp. CCM32]